MSKKLSFFNVVDLVIDVYEGGEEGLVEYFHNEEGTAHKICVGMTQDGVGYTLKINDFHMNGEVTPLSSVGEVYTTIMRQCKGG